MAYPAHFMDRHTDTDEDVQAIARRLVVIVEQDYAARGIEPSARFRELGADLLNRSSQAVAESSNYRNVARIAEHLFRCGELSKWGLRKLADAIEDEARLVSAGILVLPSGVDDEDAA